MRTLCDPTVVEAHEEYATLAAAIFTGAVVVGFASLLIAGSTLLGYVGHLGSTLVYQQGAAVYHPTETCTEFE